MTYDYLMTHPIELQQQYEKCESQDASDFCTMVRRAGLDFSQLVDERNRNPEALGAKIMDLQSQLAQKKNAEQEQQLKILYAVAALSSAQ